MCLGLVLACVAYAKVIDLPSHLYSDPISPPEFDLEFDLVLINLSYYQVAMVLAFIGFPFCFGLLFLIWIHTW